MREAAEIARDSMIIGSPGAHFIRLMISQAKFGRAIWRQDLRRAERIRLSRELGRLFLQTDPLAGA
eukprot:877894-Pyramimonas_sp.AAC.1